MEGINPDTLEFIRDKIDEIISENPDMDEKRQKIIKLRYGLDSQGPLKIRDISKMMKIPPKKMKEEVEAIEKIIFNKLKKDI